MNIIESVDESVNEGRKCTELEREFQITSFDSEQFADEYYKDTHHIHLAMGKTKKKAES